MSHDDEESFENEVVSYLEDEYGEDNVERQKYIKGIDRYNESTRRFCDIFVRGPVVDFAIEIESSFDSVWKGKTQAELYAKFLGDCVPVVALQEGHVEEPEASMLREEIQLLEFDL